MSDDVDNENVIPPDGKVHGFMCESKVISDVMLRASLAVSGQMSHRIDTLVQGFWADVDRAEDLVAIVAEAEGRLGSRKHGMLFAVFLRLVAKDYLRSLGYEGTDLEKNMTFLADVFARDPMAVELGASDVPVGPVRGKL